MKSMANWLRAVSDDYGLGGCIMAADEIERLAAENARLREALREIHETCQNTGFPDAMVMDRAIERIEELTVAALAKQENING